MFHVLLIPVALAAEVLIDAQGGLHGSVGGVSVAFEEPKKDATGKIVCPVSDRVPLGDACECEGASCEKEKYCYSLDDSKPSCMDEPRIDPSLLDWHGVTKQGPVDGRDTGAVTGRKFKFYKKSETSGLRLFYSDNLRVHGGAKHASGRWEIRIDGKDCPSGKVVQDLYVHPHHNPHRVRGFGGYCTGVGKGEHEVTVFVNPTPGYSTYDIYTGWRGWYDPHHTWHLEAQEVPEDYPYYSHVKGCKIDGRDTGVVDGRTLNFKKKQADSRVRLFYSDNLRTHSGGYCSCRWHVTIDGKECPSGPMIGDVYIHAHENSHRPRSYIGWCEGLSAGNHKAEVVVSTTPGYSNCDCYTGWHPAGAHYLLEAEEIPKHYKMVHYVRSTKQNGEDKGYLPNHKLSFTKQHSDTRLRLFYSDNLRTHSPHHHCVCHWEIHVDGKKCPSVEIFGQVYVTRLHHPTYEDTNPHRPRSFAGFCDDVAEGDHSAQIHLKAVGPACDCYTGWKDSPAKRGSAGTLEVHEFWRPCSEGTSEGACKKPKCYWNTKEKKCLDLVECPGSDKVAVGTDCRCGEEEAAKGKYCYEDKTVNEGAKAEKTEKSGALLASAAGIPLLSLALAF